MNEDRATRYQRLRRRAATGIATFTGAWLAGLIFSGGAALLRDAAASVSDGSHLATVVLFVAAVGVLNEFFLLPLRYFEGVTLEHRYGLSRQSTRHWWADFAKSASLELATVVIAGTLVALLLQWTPSWWWAFAAAGFTVALVLMAQVAPVLIHPRSDAWKPLRRQELVARLMALAARANTQVLGVFEWQLGARTKKANAALMGIGRTRRILVSDTLLAEHSDDEIEVILAHELAHHVHHDIWTMIGIQAVLIAVAMFAADRILVAAEGSFGFRGKADVAILPLLALVSGGVSLILKPLANLVSRAHERRADRYALEMTRNAPAFVSAMRRLGAQNLSDDRPSAFVEHVFHTHPSVGARISAAREWESGRPTGEKRLVGGRR